MRTSPRWGPCAALVGAGLLVSIPLGAQRPPTESIDRFLREHLAAIPNPGFSVVVVRGGEVLFQKGYGVEVAGQGAPMTARSPVAIGSQTKSFTAVAIMRLVEQGKVDLDAPVVRYLPWFRTADRRGAEITVRMLLHNTSGIPSEDRWLASRETDESAIEREVRGLSRLPLVRAPGKSFEYSNENWSVAGAIITAVSGLPYSAFLEQEVLRPLGMTRSTTALARFGEIGALWGHRARPNGVAPAAPRFLAVGLPAGSELRASAEDMGRYLTMLLRGGTTDRGRFLSEASVRELFLPGSYTTVSMPDVGVVEGRTGYAMGWATAEVDGRTVIHHGGDAIVMGSWTMIDTTTRIAASLLYNGPALDSYRYPSKISVVNNLLHLAAGEPLSDYGRPKETDPTRNDYELPADRLDRYVGEYLSGEGQRLTIAKAASGDRLLLDMTAGSNRYEYEIDFASEASAVLRNISGGLVTSFLVTPEGRVTGLAGGVSGGTFRKRSAAELAKVQDLRSPSGRVRIQLPRSWIVRWSGDGFEARDGADTAAVIRGVTIASGHFDTTRSVPASVRQRSETIGRLEWQERWWTEGEDAAARQRLVAITSEGGVAYQVSVATRVGRMTALLRDAIVPLLTTVEFAQPRSVASQ
jgi:CubicO group peptidase (beta-lactamase class C family)